jgi:ABC1 atypical kinase-like domain
MHREKGTMLLQQYLWRYRANACALHRMCYSFESLILTVSAAANHTLTERLSCTILLFHSLLQTLQVYEAKLRTGEDVVIKVQKPNAATVLKTDLSFMYVLSRLVELVNPEFANRLSLSDIVGDIRK